MYGSKAENLALLKGSGINVPGFIVVPSEDIKPGWEDKVNSFCEKRGGLFAVRSSCNLEDGAGQSFAGQFDTYLNVKADEVTGKVLKCMESVDSESVRNYLEEKNIFIKILAILGWAYLIFDGVTLLINFFIPVKFYFDEQGIYVPCITRYISLVIQIFMFFITSIYVFIFAARVHGNERLRHMTIGSFGLAMTVFVIGQFFYPLWPLYAIGYLLGTCLIHTFVLEVEKEDYRMELEDLIAREQMQKKELGSTRKLVYIDSLTGVKNKRAFTEASKEIEEAVNCGLIKEFGIVVFDLNGLKTINDLYGHDAGDQYIQEGSGIICDTFQHSPVYRIGGDEFVAFLRGNDYENREKLTASFEKIMEDNLASDKVVVSNGLSIFQGYGNDTFTKVFERADKLMYERKRYLKSKLK